MHDPQGVLTPEQWHHIEALFAEARDRDRDEREAFLNTACADDLQLKREVAALLEALDEAGPFLLELDAGRAAALIESAGEPLDQRRHIGPYRLLRRLGSGGMGVVYLAEDPRLDRLVALKFLPAYLSADGKAKRRFIEEARAASALDHPNIATVYDIGEIDDGQLYIAMAYYEGETLKDKIARGPLPIDEAITLTHQIADGLVAAHARGIVHRDVKPANLIVTEHGVVKIVDFGIAKITGTNLTKTGSALGTPAYMSPEQTHGEAMDPRTDVWSLGVVLYEMLTGQRPFRGTPDTILYAIRHDDPEPVHLVRAEVPEAIAHVVMACLTKDPAARYQRAEDVRAALRPVATGETVMPRPVWRKPSSYGSLAGLLVLLLVGALWLRPRLPAGDPAPETTAEAAEHRLAVLPLVHLSPDTADEYLADGLTEELIARLSKLNTLRVIARTSVMRYKNTDKPIAEIGRALRVSTILEGSVHKSEEQVRVMMQLVEVESQTPLWSEVYDTELQDVLAVQREIAEQVAEALGVQIPAGGQRRLASQGTANPEAYMLYLKGRYFWNKRDSASLGKSKAFFEQALDLDPTYAPAWTGLADTYTSLGSYFVMPPEEAHPRAREAAERALEIDEELAEAHASLAATLADYYWEWDAAQKHFQRAIALNPNYATAHLWYAELFERLGRFEEMLAEAKKAETLDPLAPANLNAIGKALYYLQRYDESIAQYQKILDIHPQYGLARVHMGLAYLHAGRPDEAVARWEPLADLWNRPEDLLGLLGYAYAAMDQQEQARQILIELNERAGTQHVSPFHAAVIHLGLGEHDPALDLLEEAYEERTWLMGLLHAEPVFAPLHSHPRFQALLEKMGLAR